MWCPVQASPSQGSSLHSQSEAFGRAVGRSVPCTRRPPPSQGKARPASPPERRRGLTRSSRATIAGAYPTRRSKSFASDPNRLCVSAWSAKSLMT